MAGMVGFEPTVHCTKNSCLTTWLHPNTVCEGPSNDSLEGLQGVFPKKCHLSQKMLIYSLRTHSYQLIRPTTAGPAGRIFTKKTPSKPCGSKGALPEWWRVRVILEHLPPAARWPNQGRMG